MKKITKKPTLTLAEAERQIRQAKRVSENEQKRKLRAELERIKKKASADIPLSYDEEQTWIHFAPLTVMHRLDIQGPQKTIDELLVLITGPRGRLTFKAKDFRPSQGLGPDPKECHTARLSNARIAYTFNLDGSLWPDSAVGEWVCNVLLSFPALWILRAEYVVDTGEGAWWACKGDALRAFVDAEDEGRDATEPWTAGSSALSTSEPNNDYPPEMPDDGHADFLARFFGFGISSEERYQKRKEALFGKTKGEGETIW